ncbi:CHASE domain-containing protein [Limnobacter humi]|uniref:histidine kinase n=1 Tax=Limnobacter humi TaxID=1778671 RepID=A0ABT1WDJ2_9BURK|nr:CHASE domain-containing protein [Limnobacter humi]MCQ8895592.1 CHASE domain-containing protein [Limnobacter humi]
MSKPSRRTSAKHALVDIVHNEVTAWIVLAMSLGITVAGWYVARQAVERNLAERFQFETQDATIRIQTRMRDYEQALRSGAALFKTMDTVNRQQWADYVSNLRLQAVLPGIQGLGYAAFLKPGELDSHIQSVRSEGFPDYTVTPPGQRDHYSSIVFLEPFDVRNQRAFGFDMYSDPVRKAAMDKAMDSNSTAVSGLVQLRQENGVDPQAGFLMYQPVYRKNVPFATPDERRHAIQGYVFSPFRTKDLMTGVLGLQKAAAVHFRLYDDAVEAPEHLLYDSTDSADQVPVAQRLEHRENLELPGRTWLVVYEATPALLASVPSNTPRLVLIAGTLIDALLFASIASLARQRRLLDRHNRALQASEAKFTGLVEGLQSQFAFLRLDAHGRVTYLSPTLKNLLGLPDLALGEQVLSVIHETAPGSELAKAIGLTLANRVNSKFIRDVVTPDQDDRVVEGFIHAVVGPDGQLQSVECVVHDITLRQANERELEHYRLKLQDLVLERTRELQMANQAKSQFLANMSHEIRTPLHAIIGLNSLLLGQNQDAETREKLLQSQAESRRLLAMVDDVLSFTRIESGALKLEPSQFSLRDLMAHVLKSLEREAKLQGVPVTLTLDPAVPDPLEGDPVRYRQVLNILLSNALKFSRQGTVHVHISIQGNLGSSITLMTEVRDQGIGLDPALLPRLIQPFEQVDNTATREYGGMGLGLALGNKLIELMGGALSLESTPGAGSCFRFTCRMHVHAVQAPSGLLTHGDDASAPGALDNRHVLVVEDNRLNQQVIKALLGRMNIRVSVVENGQEAVMAVRNDHSIELVLMDVHMPVMNGLDATRDIRRLPGSAATLPIIALTAAAMQEDEAACREAGMNDYLTKPVNLGMLSKTLLKFLGRRSPASEST